MNRSFVQRLFHDRSLRGETVAAFGGAGTMFLIQPPCDVWFFAWLAPLPWLWLITRKTSHVPQKFWLLIWSAGFIHWLATIHWLRLPHPATSLGWVCLSAYLAFYLPAFIWSARLLMRRWGWPLVAAAPIAWVACEQLRGVLFGGFTFAMLGHSQWRWTTLLQSADIAGAIGVSGIVMLVAAALFCSISSWRTKETVRDVVLAAGILGASIFYGHWRLTTIPEPRVAPLETLLVQGSIDTELKHDPNAFQKVTQQYDELTRSGLLERPTLPDLILWPETMWRLGLLEIDPNERLPASVVTAMLTKSELTDGSDTEDVALQALCRQRLEEERLEPLITYAKSYGTNWLVGVDKQVVTPSAVTGTRYFNCAVLLDDRGRVRDTYAKMKPVLFGEYVPFAETFPWLYRLTPLPVGLTAGHQPLVTSVAGRRLTCTICYETALPETIRSLVRYCRQINGGPDLIANLTNDGWFWGSSELDMHLTAAIFRAVEVRTPIVIAANTGFSASVDGCGRLLACGPRRKTATLRVTVVPDGRWTLWLLWGSFLPGICVAITVTVALEHWVRRGTLA
ncbi:MAG: apolipoprotein N-acyltransferase [Pirellulales bacterium]|tara:strand:- start:2779 stop:4476 length:1698 start_codon:yes stop_codon:yes gene_type:complete